ncbi:MAG: ACP S-malonyltransferase [Jaaginema sp. PMC 1079.18]|nr:ACP S-malonyltransferase [Jaaginema sp. PMC 1080.18]MEC4851813.1 ACP S-malonyltransferase [Jaaginema sp. PMC 1079.18]MEC4865999.1 ACP S-malonyltransferase [Jaaginema sp. PMC 1078.18]
MATAWLFPGQGSQTVGMGVDFKALAAAQTQFQQAEAILGWSVLEVCQSEEEKLSQTQYTQPCLYVIEAILADLLKAQNQQPQFVAGHSLGEYVALYTAGVFDFETGLKLVKQRSELMSQASGGKMVALMGFKRDQLNAEIENSAEVVIANDNNETQVVISGTPGAVEELLGNVKVRRAIPLKVSGAFHSPLMSQAAQEFAAILAAVPFATAQIPVISNIDPNPSTEAAVLKQRLVEQMTGSVRWREIMLQLADSGVNQAVEVGPGQVLSGLLKRSHPDIERLNVGTVAELQALSNEELTPA